MRKTKTRRRRKNRPAKTSDDTLPSLYASNPTVRNEIGSPLFLPKDMKSNQSAKLNSSRVDTPRPLAQTKPFCISTKRLFEGIFGFGQSKLLLENLRMIWSRTTISYCYYALWCFNRVIPSARILASAHQLLLFLLPLNNTYNTTVIYRKVCIILGFITIHHHPRVFVHKTLSSLRFGERRGVSDTRD
jgi:hypothetical protein